MRAAGATLATFWLAFSLTGCSTFATRETKLQAVKTVGIIAAVGDEMSFATGGLTGIDGRSRRFPISSWGLDDQIVRQATAALGGRYSVQPVTYTRDVFARRIENSVLTPVNVIRADPYKRLVQTAVSPQGLDAYVVITKAKSNFGSGARKIEGIGLLSYRTVMASYTKIHALYEIRVFDGKSFDLIEKLAAPPLDNTGTIRIAGPSRVIDESFALDAGDPAQNEKLRAAISDLVARSLSSTLGDMQLAASR